MKVEIHTCPMRTDADRKSKVFDSVAVSVPLELFDTVNKFAVIVDRTVPSNLVQWTGAGCGMGVREHFFRVRNSYTKYLIRRTKNWFKRHKVEVHHAD